MSLLDVSLDVLSIDVSLDVSLDVMMFLFTARVAAFRLGCARANHQPLELDNQRIGSSRPASAAWDDVAPCAHATSSCVSKRPWSSS